MKETFSVSRMENGEHVQGRPCEGSYFDEATGHWLINLDISQLLFLLTRYPPVMINAIEGYPTHLELSHDCYAY